MVVRISMDLSTSMSRLRHFVEHLLGELVGISGISSSTPRAAGADEHVGAEDHVCS